MHKTDWCSDDASRMCLTFTNQVAEFHQCCGGIAKSEKCVRMFFDCHNSAPAGTTFDTGDVITFHYTDYKITNVSSLYDERGLHHYEVYLI